jgi:choline dehydrogenase-like flavoprotein
MTSERTHYDAIIVGTGPGGGTVARELTRGSQKVLILEWGDREPVTASFGQALRELFVPGQSFLFTPDLMGVARGITTGGSSIYFCGTAYEPNFEMLAKYGIDIRDEVAEARAELPIAPLAPELIGPKSQRIMASAQALGFDWQPLDKFFYQEHCESSEPMGFYCAPSYESKWNARMWVDEAVASGAVLQTGARVREVLVEGKTATGVVYTQAGQTLRAHADKIVVSAGGIGSPMILRASGIRGAGEDFFVDPLIFAMGQVDELEGPSELPMSAGINCVDDGYMMTDFFSPRPLHVAAALQVGRVGQLRARAYARSLGIMVKAKDLLGGHLSKRGGVRRRLAREDAAKLQHGYERARAILAEAGARSIYKTGTLAAHPGGTVKVGELLDENLRTEFSNLYVCDCSVVPEAWGLPPTLALIGFGKRLARHLLGAEKPASANVSAVATAGGRG